MWVTSVVFATLSCAPAADDGLTLTNIRTTHGLLGVQRTAKDFLPGDRFVLHFDIDGIKVDETGKSKYSIALDVTDADGKVVFGQKPKDLEVFNALGGARFPASANVDIGLNQPPGEYNVKVTVNDRGANQTKTIAEKIKVLPKGFGLVRLSTTVNPKGDFPSPLLGTGQSIWVNFGAVGFERGDNKLPNVAVSLRVLDENGKPTTSKPFTGEANKDVPEKALGIPMQFLLALNRAGNFTVEITANDLIGKKTAKVTFPLKVQATK